MPPTLTGRLRAALDKSGTLDRLSAVGALQPLSWVGALDLLAQAHGTDKSSRYHAYTRWYRRHLSDLRGEPVTLIEIGVGGDEDPSRGGRSLRMWRDYLRRAKVFGIDVHEKRLIGLGSRVEVLRADQSSPDDLAAVLEHTGAPDVVIDDGSHVGEHIWCSFEALFPALRPGGWYVLEDLHTSFLEGFGSAERRPIGVALDGAVAVQDLDPTLVKLRRSSGTTVMGPSEVHVYPGIAFIRKAK
jgi:Methyltransferase domain